MSRTQMSDKPLKILMIAPTPYFSDRGCHVRIYEEAQALTDRGHSVRIVTYHLGRDLPSVPVDRIVSVPWYRKKEAGPSWHKLYLDLMLLLKVLAVAFRFRPGIIHAHLHEGVVVGWPVAILFRLPLIFDYQGSLSGESLDHGFFRSGSLLHRLFRALEGWINRRADFIICSSTAAVDRLVAEWGVAQDAVASLPDGVDTNRFYPHSKAEARSYVSRLINREFDDDCPLVVYLGLLNSYQGTDLLLDAAALLKERGLKAHFLLMGFPEQSYREKAARMGLSDYLSFTGRVDYQEAALLLSAGDLAVSPKIASTEANGKLLNYMACGIPTIAFDTAVNRELLGEHGIYAPPGDLNRFAEMISQALRDTESLKQRAVELRNWAEEQHSLQGRAVLLEQHYSQFI